MGEFARRFVCKTVGGYKIMSKRARKIFILILILLFLLALLFINYNFFSQERIILATTTSTDNTGLLNEIIPVFEKETGYRVDIVAVGTGKALELGRNGDADLLLVHAEKAEMEFINQGYGIKRQEIMYNDFVILGPEDDPANIKNQEDLLLGFSNIASNNSVFISRGDDSGTHQKEKSIWKKAEVIPEGDWYQEVGQGMAVSLSIANEKKAYILCDRASFLAYKNELDLKILFERDQFLKNQYSFIIVNPDLGRHINHQGAISFLNFILSHQGKDIIREFEISGEKLFYLND